jgi:hypothetical protein
MGVCFAKWQAIVLAETDLKLDELRSLVRRIEEEGGKTRALIAEQTGVRHHAITKFLGARRGTSNPKGINGESALRLWEYAQEWLRNASTGQEHEPTGHITIKAKRENQLRVSSDLGVVVPWLGSIRETTKCMGLATAAGGRMILRLDDRNLGRKIANFKRSWKGATAQDVVTNADTIVLKRYLEEAWTITIRLDDSNEYENEYKLEIVHPPGVIQCGAEVAICALEPDGLELFGPRSAGTMLDLQLMDAARRLPTLLDSCDEC